MNWEDSMKKFDINKLLKSISILFAMEVGMGLPPIICLSHPYADGFGIVIAVVLSAFAVPFLFGLTKVKLLSKVLMTAIAATIYDILFVLITGSDMETLVVYFLVLCVVSLVGVSLGSLMNFIIKVIIRKAKKSDSILKKEEG